MNLFAKVFSAIMPLKGSKTVIGGWLVALGTVSQIVPGLDLASVASAVIANPTKAGVILAVLGVADKVIRPRRKVSS